ncbi:hypothetical protein BC939DRAFT_506888 [Gamsiella multidivaricata]|uniref:uncharacterized protein n=1 Tax=Gamsiella multidivaricata TaxID=101098 RepID=UPI00222030B7|nr:uncharacterized protein BC939DRAFT_506888 [Gamsiella multidivaricata]KAI7818034.1 hypothetical protein BC939DRAFT_506888 [Gamsiella multidivaricata]
MSSTTTSCPLPFTLSVPSPTADLTNSLDPPQRHNPSDTLLIIIAIVSCIGLLGFGIGYLRLRQMRLVAIRFPSSSSLALPMTTSLSGDPSDLEAGTNCSRTRLNIQSPQPQPPLPIYTAAQVPENLYSEHQHTGKAPPPPPYYQHMAQE